MLDGDCQTFISDCQVRAATDLVKHIWDPVVLSALRVGPTRRHALHAQIRDVSDKALTESLRRLQHRGLVARDSGTNVPGRSVTAVYRLTPLGESFAHGPLAALAQWAADHHDELAGAGDLLDDERAAPDARRQPNSTVNAWRVTVRR